MDVDYISLAVPLLVFIVFLEFFYSLYRKKSYFRLNDSMCNISCGLISLLSSIIYAGLLVLGYMYLEKNFAIFDISLSNPINWVLAYLAQDFCYYWFHRASHRINFFWAAHSVHHQSEEYNLSVALRQSFIQDLQSWIFYLPMALLGFPIIMYLVCRTINPLYQFWIHTKFINKMGWLEHIFNTPSHHRVHHGKNPQYLDKNHAGTLIIWDKMFGTFEPEKETVVYGVTEPLNSWNPLWVNIKPWVNLYQRAKSMPGLKNKLLIWIKPPEWEPGKTDTEVDVDLSIPKYDAKTRPSKTAYIFLNYLVIASLGIYLNNIYQQLPQTIMFTTLALVILSLIILGALSENKTWAKYSEFFRLTFIVIFITKLVGV